MWGFGALVVVTVAGFVAGEPAGTVLTFAAGAAVVVGIAGYFREPPEPPTDADRMSWLFGTVFRIIGRGR